MKEALVKLNEDKIILKMQLKVAVVNAVSERSLVRKLDILQYPTA